MLRMAGMTTGPPGNPKILRILVLTLSIIKKLLVKEETL
jgi:hypothetical protein